MTARVIFGPLKTPELHGEHGHGDSHPPGDLNAREIAILVPLALAVIYLGVYPSAVLRSMNDPLTMMQQPIIAASMRHLPSDEAQRALAQAPMTQLVMKP